MAVKGGIQKLPQPGAELESKGYTRTREDSLWIAGAPGKSTLPWKEIGVRDDVMKQLNVKQPERLMLMLDWLSERTHINKRFLVEEMLREGLERRLKDMGVDI